MPQVLPDLNIDQVDYVIRQIDQFMMPTNVIHTRNGVPLRPIRPSSLKMIMDLPQKQQDYLNKIGEKPVRVIADQMIYNMRKGRGENAANLFKVLCWKICNENLSVTDFKPDVQRGIYHFCRLAVAVNTPDEKKEPTKIETMIDAVGAMAPQSREEKIASADHVLEVDDINDDEEVSKAMATEIEAGRVTGTVAVIQKQEEFPDPYLPPKPKENRLDGRP